MRDLPLALAAAPLSTALIMRLVLLAALPALLLQTWHFGWGTVLQVVWLGLLALGVEALALRLRGQPWRAGLADGSALVTALLLAVSLPATAPWWLGLCGIAFALLLGKHVYGGLGFNPFNPAMAAYALLLLSFPLEMTRWLPARAPDHVPPGLLDSLGALFSAASAERIDAFAGATLLDAFRQREGLLASEFLNASSLYGQWSARGWEWVSLGWLAGGLLLLWRRIITWHIPLALLGSLALLAALFHDGGSSTSPGSPLLHLLGGASMLGAFFIATDPVSAAVTPRGKLLYGALIGALVYVIRAWGNYPDGMAFAVLLGNFAAPALDALCRPRALGRDGP